MESEETLRWPTNLDRSAIEQRLIQARATAEKQGWKEVAALLAGVESKSAAEIAQERDGLARVAAAAARAARLHAAVADGGVEPQES